MCGSIICVTCFGHDQTERMKGYSGLGCVVKGHQLINIASTTTDRPRLVDESNSAKNLRFDRNSGYSPVPASSLPTSGCEVRHSTTRQRTQAPQGCTRHQEVPARIELIMRSSESRTDQRMSARKRLDRGLLCSISTQRLWGRRYGREVNKIVRPRNLRGRETLDAKARHSDIPACESLYTANLSAGGQLGENMGIRPQC